jgi:hypothetical protein
MLSGVPATRGPLPTERDAPTVGLALSLDSRLSECADQNGTNEGEYHADRQHIQFYGKINGHLSPRCENRPSLSERRPNPKQETCCGAEKFLPGYQGND